MPNVFHDFGTETAFQQRIFGGQSALCFLHYMIYTFRYPKTDLLISCFLEIALHRREIQFRVLEEIQAAVDYEAGAFHIGENSFRMKAGLSLVPGTEIKLDSFCFFGGQKEKLMGKAVFVEGIFSRDF